MKIDISPKNWTLDQAEAIERLSHDADFKVFMQILLSSRAELLESLSHETRDVEVRVLQGAAQHAEAVSALVDSSSDIVKAVRQRYRGS